MLHWIVVATALADPASDLAPGPAELSTSLERTATHLDRAEALEVAANRLQNAWGSRLAAGPQPSCADPAMASLAARMGAFGQAWRDAAQSARAEAARLDRIIAAPTVTPLLDEASTETARDLSVRVRRQVRVYEEHLAWTRAHVPLRACPSELSPAAGIASAVPAAREDHERVALIGLGGGLVCPAALPADGTAIVLDGTEACWTAAATCDCTPEPVLPGAVLGP